MALTKSIQAVFQGSPVSSSYQPVASEVTTLLTEMTDGHLDQVAMGLGSAGAPSYSFYGDLNTGIFSPTADTVAIGTAGVEALRVNSGGSVIIGASAGITGGFGAALSVEGTTNANSTVSTFRASADIYPAMLRLTKSRGATVTDYTIVQAGDGIGSIIAMGADGAQVINSAQIQAYVIGTPALNDVRGGWKITVGTSAGNTSTALDINPTTIAASYPIKLPSYTVAGLPAAATVGAGARAYVTDANATTFMSTVAGGGANKVPVHSDGTNWKIG